MFTDKLVFDRVLTDFGVIFWVVLVFCLSLGCVIWFQTTYAQSLRPTG